MRGSPLAVSAMRVALGFLVWAEWADRLRAAPLWDWPWTVAWTSVFWVSSPLLVVGACSRTMALLTGGICLAAHLTLPASPAPSVAVAPPLLALATMLLATTPCGGCWSVDRWLAERRGAPAPPDDDLWGVLALRVLLGGFLAGTAWALATRAWPAAVVAAGLAVALGVPRTRTWAALAVMALAALVVPWTTLGVLPMTVATLAVAFLDPALVRRRFDELRGPPA